MIKTILAWITGKSDTKAPEVPYKVEAQPAMTNVAIGTEAVYVAPEAVAPEAVVTEAVIPAAIETVPVTVKAKYKRVDLNKMTKAELMELVTKHSLEVKARATKEEMVKALVKV
jgi:hypothetical protein